MAAAASTPRAPSTSILQETFAALCAVPAVDIEARRVARFRLGRYFTVVELDDGSVGSCMSYSAAGDGAIASLAARLQDALADDPLWQASLCKTGGDPLLLSLRASLLSALSAPILQAGGDGTTIVSRTPLWDPLAGMQSALVIGFGGYMRSFARDPRIARLHIADLEYPRRRAEMDRAIAALQQARPEAAITVSDGHDTREQMRVAGLVAITGSALCNGSMERLLDWARGRRVIVQGQSAAIYPAALFARGVSFVATTLKPRNLIAIADRGALPSLFEGGLPWVYLYDAAQLAQQLTAAASRAG